MCRRAKSYCMQFGNLKHYPRLESVFSKDFRMMLMEICPQNSPAEKTASQKVLRAYGAFIDIVDFNKCGPYTGLDILNSSNALNKQIKLVIGFIYHESDSGFTTRYQAAKTIYEVLLRIPTTFSLEVDSIKLSERSLSLDAQYCVNLYKNEKKDEKKLEYYNGWKVEDKYGNTSRLNLAKIYDAYGNGFTTQIHAAFKLFALTQKPTSLSSVISYLSSLLNDFVQLMPELEDLNHALQPHKAMETFEKVLSLNIARKIKSNKNIKEFLSNQWLITLSAYDECLVQSRIFGEPLRPLLAPVYKTPLRENHSVSTGGGLNKKSRDRLLTNIPLSITDENAIQLIFNRINKDIEHIRITTQKFINEIKQRHKRNTNLIKIGIPKNLTENLICKNGRFQPYPIGPDNLANTIATFHKYRTNYESYNYLAFLGYRSKNKELIKELNLPTSLSIMSFLCQLVLEHPQITPSWLVEWALFSKSGAMVGLVDRGSHGIIISFKNRLTPRNAQQEIHLNSFSRSIVDTLIMYTQIARDHLKAQGDDGWRYMLLVFSSVKVPPRRLKKICASPSILRDFQNSFAVESRDTEGDIILTNSEAKTLAPLINLRPIRSSRGVQVYLETHSVKAMSEALGHKEHNPKLLESYLPDTLLSYFNDRWIRIFQNGIIYEAMKDSKYIMQSVDFSPSELDEFLKNHQLGQLPDHIKAGKKIAQSIESEPEKIRQFDELVITLSTPVLQVLIAIKTIAESAEDGDKLPSIINKWHEAAVFIINQLIASDSKQARFSQSLQVVLPLFDLAKLNPLNTNKLKEKLCLSS